MRSTAILIKLREDGDCTTSMKQLLVGEVINFYAGMV